jgi:hypothetical protein
MTICATVSKCFGVSQPGSVLKGFDIKFLQLTPAKHWKKWLPAVKFQKVDVDLIKMKRSSIISTAKIQQSFFKLYIYVCLEFSSSATVQGSYEN